MDLTITVLGKPVVIGEVYEDRLPCCQRKRCANRIPIKRIYHSATLKNAEPLYCSKRCAMYAAQAAEYGRKRAQRELTFRVVTAARHYASTMFRDTPKVCDQESLRMMALTELRHQGIGVRREGHSFVVDEACLTAFLTALYESAGSCLIVREPRTRPTLVRFTGDELRLLSRAGLTAQARSITTWAAKAKLIEQAGQIAIARSTLAIDRDLRPIDRARKRRERRERDRARLSVA